MGQRLALRLARSFFFPVPQGGRLAVASSRCFAMLMSNLFLLGSSLLPAVFPPCRARSTRSFLLGALVSVRLKILRLPYYFCMINAAVSRRYHALRGGAHWPETRICPTALGGTICHE